MSSPQDIRTMLFIFGLCHLVDINYESSHKDNTSLVRKMNGNKTNTLWNHSVYASQSVMYCLNVAVVFWESCLMFVCLRKHAVFCLRAKKKEEKKRWVFYKKVIFFYFLIIPLASWHSNLVLIIEQFLPGALPLITPPAPPPSSLTPSTDHFPAVLTDISHSSTMHG